MLNCPSIKYVIKKFINFLRHSTSESNHLSMEKANRITGKDSLRLTSGEVRKLWYWTTGNENYFSKLFKSLVLHNYLKKVLLSPSLVSYLSIHYAMTCPRTHFRLSLQSCFITALIRRQINH